MVHSLPLRQLRGLGLGAFPDPWRQFPRLVLVSATHGTSAAPTRHILEMPFIADFFCLDWVRGALCRATLLLSPATLICFRPFVYVRGQSNKRETAAACRRS